MSLSVNELSDYVISLRREFHRHPEISMEEEWTCARICQELPALGIPCEIVGDKNVIGRLEFGEGRRIAFRADFDALPVGETLDVPWKSQQEDAMHACGHDGHTAALLGAARLLRSAGERLRGTVYLCFQQGEEVGEGARECVEYLKRSGGVDMAIGAHLFPAFETGTIDVDPGLRAKGAGFFTLTSPARADTAPVPISCPTRWPWPAISTSTWFRFPPTALRRPGPVSSPHAPSRPGRAGTSCPRAPGWRGPSVSPTRRTGRR